MQLYLKQEGGGNEPNLYNCICSVGRHCYFGAFYAGSRTVLRILRMKKKTKKFILEFLEFWPLTIVIPLMLIGIVLGAALGWGG